MIPLSSPMSQPYCDGNPSGRDAAARWTRFCQLGFFRTRLPGYDPDYKR